MSEIDYATYSPEDNKLRLYSGRVSQELYDSLAESGYRRAYKQGCFFATWTPGREDIALGQCGGIETDDLSLEERAQDRSERFDIYSTNAGHRKQDAWERSRQVTAGIPFGQPILVGHHSERRHRNAIEKSRRLSDKGMEELHKENYWAKRATASLNHAERKYAPRTTFNRIKKLKAEVRKRQRHIDPKGEQWFHDQQWLKSFHEKTDEEIAEIWTRRVEITNRWIAHLEGQIQFWQTIYDEVGGVAADTNKWDLQVGGWVKGRVGWGKVKRITRRNGEILSVSLDKDTLKERWYPHVVKYQEITGYSVEEPGQ